MSAPAPHQPPQLSSAQLKSHLCGSGPAQKTEDGMRQCLDTVHPVVGTRPVAGSQFCGEEIVCFTGTNIPGGPLSIKRHFYLVPSYDKLKIDQFSKRKIQKKFRGKFRLTFLALNKTIFLYWKIREPHFRIWIHLTIQIF